MAEYARALHAIPCDTTVFGSWIDLGDFGYGDPLVTFRISKNSFRICKNCGLNP